MIITTEVDLVWYVKDADNYQFTKDGRCFNRKSGKEIKRTVIGYTEGFCINSKFRSLKQIRKQLIKNDNFVVPF